MFEYAIYRGFVERFYERVPLYILPLNCASKMKADE